MRLGSDLGGGKGTRPSLGPIYFYFYFLRRKVQFIYLFIVIIYFIFVIGPSSKTLSPFFSITLASLTQITTIQPENLIKTIKSSTMVIVFLKKKNPNYFTTKKLCVIGETKAKLFVTTVNWYKYQLVIASC